MFFAFNFTLLTFNCRAEESGAAFLKIDAGARAVGMGGAFTALADDASAVYWNPAGLAGLQRREAMASHSEWLDGLDHESLSYAHPGLWGGALGAGITSLRSGPIEGRDAQGRRAGSFSGADTAFTVSFAKGVGGSRLGVSLKLIEQRLASSHARGAAVDVGMVRPLAMPGLTWGVAAQNLGPKMAFEGSRAPLPTVMKTGLGYSPGPSLTLSADLKVQPSRRQWEMAYGMELKVAPAVALRAGYQFHRFGGSGSPSVYDAGGSAGGLAGFQGGFGVALNGDYRLDYAVIPLADAGAPQRLSLSAKF